MNPAYRPGDKRLKKPKRHTHRDAVRARRAAAKAAPKRRSPAKRASLSADRKGSADCRKRSGGRCEAWNGGDGWSWRCHRAAVHVHHMIGGHGKRGIGISALAEHKQHVCEQCHLDIGGGVGGRKLHRVGGIVPCWTDHYERTR